MVATTRRISSVESVRGSWSLPAYIRLHRLSVRTPDFQSGKTGSIPVGATEVWQSGRMQRFAKS